MSSYIVKVDTVDSQYDVVIGESIINSIENFEEVKDADKIAVVISLRVFGLHRQFIENALKNFPDHKILLMDDSEENKSYSFAEDFLEKLLNMGFTRKSLLISIGGGVVGDFTGYLAALYMRGIFVIHIPTTLLAFVDSSVGGKVAVNLSAGKNIAGAFHQPIKVISDIKFLTTLEDKEFRNGLTEAFKHGLIGDNSTYKIFIDNDFNSIKESKNIMKLIERSVQFKASIVKKDVHEGGVRAILNFGHTIAHSMESLLKYKGISHGEAVAMGIKVEVRLSEKMGWLSKEDREGIEKLLKKYNLADKIFDLDYKDILDHMKYDKKNFSGKINFVLLKGIGNPVYNINVDEDILIEVLKQYFK